MKRETVNYLVAGGVVLGALALLLTVLYRVTGRTGEAETYHAYYERVLGVRFGTPVYFEGYRIGQVEQVVPEHDGVLTSFRVNFTVEEGWPIPDDSVAVISTSGLLSDVFILIDEGESDQALEPGARIDSRESADLFAALGDLASEIEALTETELGPALKRVTRRIEAVAADLEAEAPHVVDDVREMMARLNESAAAVREFLGEENRQILVRTFRNLEQTSDDAARLARELRETRNELDALVSDARALVSENRPDLNRSVEGLEATLTEMSRRIDGIAFNLEEASRHFNEFTRSIRRNPSRLLYTPEPDETEPEDR